MYTREGTLLAEEIRERQPVNFALENLGRKEMERKENSLQNERRFKGKILIFRFLIGVSRPFISSNKAAFNLGGS